MSAAHRIVPCLWFDTQAEDAANFYVSVFKNSKINLITRYSTAGQETHHQKPGSVMTVEFELDGEVFTALNAGPVFKFNEAVSFQIMCDTQAEVDHYWNTLTAGGDPKAQQCGWLKDKFGLSWQVVPRKMIELMKDHQSEDAKKAMTAMLKMKKIDIAEIERAVAQ
jgi:predicted 3-demethylubiquinone-9 3-methyltransferase (glyoxalase superfamily)